MANSNLTYWQKREMRQRARLYDKAVSELDRELARQYSRTGQNIRRELLSLLEELRNSDGDSLISDLYKGGRYFEMLNQINEELTRLGGKQIEGIERTLLEVYEKQSAMTASEFGLYNTVDKEAARRVINEIWCSDGQGFSDRIWRNKDLLVQKLEDSLFDFVARGQKTDQLVTDLIAEQVPLSEFKSVLDDDFREAYNNARRLVRTETARVQNRATQDRYRDAGFTQYRIVAEPDCCDVCADLAEQVFSIDELVIPAHPNCRCAMAAITESLK